MIQPVEVEIFGRKFRLRSDNPQDAMDIANTINQELHQLSDLYDNLDFTKLLLLITLKKQDEIKSLTLRNDNLEIELERLNQMVEKIIGDI